MEHAPTPHEEVTGFDEPPPLPGTVPATGTGDPPPEKIPPAPEHARDGREVPSPDPDPDAADTADAADAADTADAADADDAADAGMAHPLVQDLMLDPSRWSLWPAVGVLRWLLRRTVKETRRLVYRSSPTLNFPTSEIKDAAITSRGVDLVLSAPGLAAVGSALPTSDIARLAEDSRREGALSMWLDAPGDRFMQAVEANYARYSAAFSLATGGQIEVLRIIANLAGRSAPLVADRGGELAEAWNREPVGAVGLAGMFVGPITASCLSETFQGFTNLPVEVREFTGAAVIVLRPTRVGGSFGAMLGSTCHLPAAGCEVVINGGARPEAQKWALDPERRRSLHLLAASYVGAISPAVNIFLLLAPGNAPPAALDGNAAFGGLAILGNATETVRIPIRT